MKKRLFALLLAVACVISTTACAEEEEDNTVIIEKEAETPSYNYAYAAVGDVIKTEKYVLTYKQTEAQEVVFEVAGKYVDKVHVKEGDKVKKGDILVELSSGDLERRIQDLQYSLDRNMLNLEYLETDEHIAIENNWYTSQQYHRSWSDFQKSVDDVYAGYRYKREDLQDAIDADSRELAAMKKELKASRVYAELDGIVYKLKERLVGTTSNTDTVIMYIVDSSKCMFEGKDASFTQYFEEGKVVEMSISFGNSAPPLELLPVNMSEWGETQLFEVLELPEGTELKMGASGTMYVETGRKENVLTIPISSVYSAGEKNYCYILGDDMSREMRWITVGAKGDDLVEVTEGLTEGEKVIRKW